MPVSLVDPVSTGAYSAGRRPTRPDAWPRAIALHSPPPRGKHGRWFRTGFQLERPKRLATQLVECTCAGSAPCSRRQTFRRALGVERQFLQPFRHHSGSLSDADGRLGISSDSCGVISARGRTATSTLRPNGLSVCDAHRAGRPARGMSTWLMQPIIVSLGLRRGQGCARSHGPRFALTPRVRVKKLLWSRPRMRSRWPLALRQAAPPRQDRGLWPMMIMMSAPCARSSRRRGWKLAS